MNNFLETNKNEKLTGKWEKSISGGILGRQVAPRWPSTRVIIKVPVLKIQGQFDKEAWNILFSA
jgi:hypothetical protein